jgi:hypothetical protein
VIFVSLVNVSDLLSSFISFKFSDLILSFKAVDNDDDDKDDEDDEDEDEEGEEDDDIF